MSTDTPTATEQNLAYAIRELYFITEERDRLKRELGVATEALAQIHDSHDAYCENHIGIAQHSHDLCAIADEALEAIRALSASAAKEGNK